MLIGGSVGGEAAVGGTSEGIVGGVLIGSGANGWTFWIGVLLRSLCKEVLKRFFDAPPTHAMALHRVLDGSRT